MSTLMLQFKHTGPAPTVDDVRRLFNLEANEIDSAFGVIATDPDQGLFTVRVAPTAASRVRAVLATRRRDSAEGLFADTPIAPFGPPEK